MNEPVRTKVGVLALQGSCEPHCQQVEALGLTPVSVRRRSDLSKLSHLILPGGESTTIHHLMSLFGLWQPIIDAYREGKLALFGTCAGAILLGREEGLRPPRMQLLDAIASRNGYGRQVDSFTEEVDLVGLAGDPFHCVFIRAPRFLEVGPDCEVMGRRNEEAILVSGPGLLAATFHPELTDDLRIHRWFVEHALQSRAGQRVESFNAQS